MTQILPPGMSAADFAEALQALRKIVGNEHVLTGEALASYADPYSIVADDAAHAASAAVAPASTAQVQEIVRAANQHGMPLWPVSCGKNFAYGGAAPRMAGTVVLDLKRMNRILEVSEDDGYALVEGRGEVYEVMPGDPVPGLGRIEQIRREGGRWVVVTQRGIVVSMRDRRYFEPF